MGHLIDVICSHTRKPTKLKGTQIFKTGHDDVNIETMIGRYYYYYLRNRKHVLCFYYGPILPEES